MTFTPPVLNRVPAVLPDTRGLALLLYRHVAPLAQGLNVYKYADGTYVVDRDPEHTTAEFAIDTAPVITYYGGHVYQVTDAEAAELSAAGFGAFLSASIVDPNLTNPPAGFGSPPSFYGGDSPPGYNPLLGLYRPEYTGSY